MTEEDGATKCPGCGRQTCIVVVNTNRGGRGAKGKASFPSPVDGDRREYRCSMNCGWESKAVYKRGDWHWTVRGKYIGGPPHFDGGN